MKKVINRKGFTLIELVAVVAIMAVLATLIIPNVTKMADNNKKERFVTEGKQMLSKAKYLLKIQVLIVKV